MDKRTKRRTAVELGKDLLIILLSCSALWMLGDSGLWQRLNLSQERAQTVTGQQNTATDQAEAARPMRITVTLQGNGEPVRCSLQYDEATVDTMFQQVAGLLMETLSSAETPQEITRRDWEQALAQSPGFCFDFQGQMPLSVLTGWLSVEHSVPDAVVRRVLLTVWEDSVALYYYDFASQNWYRCTTQVVSAVQLENALVGLTTDGAYYAFESDVTGQMAPDTVLIPNPEPLAVYNAVNPVTGGRGALEGLMTDLNFNLAGCIFYPAADEEVARSGSDTLRLSTDGVVEYHADEDSAQQFPVNRIPGEDQMFAAVESCRQLLRQVMGERCGQVRTYLSQVEQTETGWHLEFEYSLNGVPVTLEQGAAASFEVKNGYVTAFTIRLRSYAAGDETQLILPPVQAAAAMSTLDLEGRELQLTYWDSGEEQIAPSWTAVLDEAR